MTVSGPLSWVCPLLAQTSSYATVNWIWLWALFDFSRKMSIGNGSGKVTTITNKAAKEAWAVGR